MNQTINLLISSIIGGAIVAFVNFFLRKRERHYFEELKYRRESYVDLLNNVKCNRFSMGPKYIRRRKNHNATEFY